MLLGAAGQALNLSGSVLPGLTADGLELSGALFLRHGFEAREDAVRLTGARIHGNLECGGGRFLGRDGYGNALVAEGLDIKGGVVLSDGFEAHGAVRLLGARIGGQLNCTGGHFLEASRDGDALLADRLETKGGVFLSTAPVGRNLFRRPRPPSAPPRPSRLRPHPHHGASRCALRPRLARHP